MIDEKLIEEILENLEKPNNTQFETGFEDLDAILKLNNNEGAVITIGGRPAMGKTTLILSVLEKFMKQKKKVLLFSLETSAKNILQRLLFQNAEISSEKLHTKNLLVKDWDKLIDSQKEMKNWDLTIIDKSGITVEQIEEKIKANKPEFVFIDYFQLIETQTEQDRVSQIDSIMRNLKRIAQENKIMIFITSQLSRAIEAREDKRPMLTDLRESSAIENVSDLVIFIYRQDYYGIENPNGKSEIIIAKNRFGKTATINMYFNQAIPKFY